MIYPMAIWLLSFYINDGLNSHMNGIYNYIYIRELMDLNIGFDGISWNIPRILMGY